MRVALPMEWDTGENETRHKPMETATCIYIPSHKRFAVFRFKSGITECIYLEDTSKLACNVKLEAVKIPAEFIKRENRQTGNNGKIEDALFDCQTTKAAVSRKAGRSGPYLAAIMRSRELTDDETAYWLDLIHGVAREITPLDEHDPNYRIKTALKDCELSAKAASRLLGYCDTWLSNHMRAGIPEGRQTEIAAELRKRATAPTGGPQGDPAGRPGKVYR